MEPIVPKIVKWSARSGIVSRAGEMIYWAYQKAVGAKKHSGGVGKRGRRLRATLHNGKTAFSVRRYA